AEKAARSAPIPASYAVTGRLKASITWGLVRYTTSPSGEEYFSVTWLTVSKNTEVLTLSRKGLPVASTYFTPKSMKSSQVDHSAVTSSMSDGRPASSSRSARYAIAIPPASVGTPIDAPSLATACWYTH